jgi:DNA-binding response OmpR family regulator
LAKFFKKRGLKADPRLREDMASSGSHSTGKQWTESNSGSWQKLRCKELELICYLYANAGRIIFRDELLSKVWKCQQTMTTRTVDQTISSLRRKLGDDAESPRYLITVYGVGYTLGTFSSYAPESRKTARALR